MTQRVAAIDCGTNSIRLLIADINSTADGIERTVSSPGGSAVPPSPLTDVAREMRIVRLGEGVDRTGRLSEAALDRTMTALREYAGLIEAAAPDAIRMVATSATRDAANADEFVRGVTGILGVPPEVLSGSQEASLSFTGATAELARPGAGGPRLAPPYLVVDIGGGSTEFVLGGDHAGGIMRDRESGAGGPGENRAGDALAAVSVDIGCVRLTERHLHSDPPAGAEIDAAVADIDAAIDLAVATVPARRARTFVGLAGSVTTVAGLALGLPGYDAGRIHHARITAAQVHAVTRMLLGQTRAERALLPVMHPGRVDVIGAGALVLDRIITRLGFAEVVASEHDILDGIAWSLAGRRGR